MGLGMIDTMKIFDAERHEGIKMRVGIHTGKLHCFILLMMMGFLIGILK
jgi:adenylate cyclase 9